MMLSCVIQVRLVHSWLLQIRKCSYLTYLYEQRISIIFIMSIRDENQRELKIERLQR